MERTSGTSKWDRAPLPPLSYATHYLETSDRVYLPKIEEAILAYFGGSRPRDINKKLGLNEEERRTVENETSRIKGEYKRNSRQIFPYASAGRHFRIRGIAGDV